MHALRWAALVRGYTSVNETRMLTCSGSVCMGCCRAYRVRLLGLRRLKMRLHRLRHFTRNMLAYRLHDLVGNVRVRGRLYTPRAVGA